MTSQAATTRSSTTRKNRESTSSSARWRKRTPFSSFDEAKQAAEQKSSDNDTVQFFGHRKRVTCLGWNCDGSFLASGSSDLSIVLHRTDSPSALRYPQNDQQTKLTGHPTDIVSLSWHPTATQVLLSGSEEGMVKIWDLRKETKQASVATLQRGRLVGCMFAPDGNSIAIADANNSLALFDTRRLSSTLTVLEESQLDRKQQPFDFCWANNGEHILMTNKEGAVDIYSVQDGLRHIHSFPSHVGICYCVKMCQSGEFISTGGADGMVTLWTVEDLCCVRTFPVYLEPVKCLDFSFDSQMIASASEEKFININWVGNGETVKEIVVETKVTALEWNPKHYLLAYACEDKRYENYLGNTKIWGFEI